MITVINYMYKEYKREEEIEKIETIIGDCEAYELSLCCDCYNEI